MDPTIDPIRTIQPYPMPTGPLVPSIEATLDQYERDYSYAIRTPWQSIPYTSKDADELYGRATTERLGLKKSLDILLAAQIPRDTRTYQDITTRYATAIDTERRAEQLVNNRDMYIPRKAVSYLGWFGHAVNNWLDSIEQSINKYLFGLR